MKKIMEQYGDVVLAVVVLLALAAIIIGALASDGYVATQFKETFMGFFDSMNALG